MEQWTTVTGVAEHLGFSRAWVYRNMYSIPHVRMGKEYRFKLSLVEEWFASYLEGDLA